MSAGVRVRARASSAHGAIPAAPASCIRIASGSAWPGWYSMRTLPVRTLCSKRVTPGNAERRLTHRLCDDRPAQPEDLRADPQATWMVVNQLEGLADYVRLGPFALVVRLRHSLRSSSMRLVGTASRSGRADVRDGAARAGARDARARDDTARAPVPARRRPAACLAFPSATRSSRCSFSMARARRTRSSVPKTAETPETASVRDESTVLRTTQPLAKPAKKIPRCFMIPRLSRSEATTRHRHGRETLSSPASWSPSVSVQRVL